MYFLILALVCISPILADDAAREEFIRGNYKFTAKVCKEIAEKYNRSNFIMSPFSIETAMAITHAGAKDETAKEIRSGMFFPDSREKIDDSFKSFWTYFKEDDDYYKFKQANKIYCKKDFSVAEDFKKVVEEVYRAGIESIDFFPADKCAKDISDWVEKETDKKIKDFMDPKDIGEDSKMIIVNAMKFKGNWSKTFESADKIDFYRKADDVVKAESMAVDHDFEYYDDPEIKAKFVKIPIEGKDAYFYIAVPYEKDGIYYMDKYIDKVFEDKKFKKEYVKVWIPKYKIESKFDFKEILYKMGVKRPFDEEKADFSGFGAGKDRMYVSKIYQKSFFEIDERGIEAAAATEVVINLVRVNRMDKPIEFKADRPFIFYVKIKDAVVFAGKVFDPYFKK